MTGVELHNGDCLDVLRGLKSNSVDAVITDPPYGIDFQCGHRAKHLRHRKIANDKQPFIWFLHDTFRITKDNGCLVCFCRWDVQETFRIAIETAGYTVKSQVIWDRVVHGMGDLSGSFAPQHDVIWFASKGRFKFPSSRPHSVIQAQRVGGSDLVHPNEKPLSLMQKLIKAVTREGETVLDCFMRSGATGVAAVSTGREFVGIELDAGHFETAKERITAAQPMLV